MKLMLNAVFSSVFLTQNVCLVKQLPVLTQVREYAARKGTRERKKKAMVKKEEVVKETFQAKKLRLKEEEMRSRGSLIFDDSFKPSPIDNVYRAKFYKWPVYSFEEAIKMHRETHHPHIINKPFSDVNVTLELNMELPKKNKYVDNFYRVADIPFRFEHGEERRILGFAKDASDQQNGRNAGAMLVGGAELVKEVQSGNVSLHDFDYVVAHPNILPELVSLRGLMKKKFPNPKVGTLDANFSKTIERFLHGISYSGVKDNYQKDFGLVNATIGKLDMDLSSLEQNLQALLADVLGQRGSSKIPFIRRCLIFSPPTVEKLCIEHSKYHEESSNLEEEGDEEPEPIEAKA